MRHLRTPTLLLAGLVVAGTTGCGRKPLPDNAPEPAAAVPTRARSAPTPARVAPPPPRPTAPAAGLPSAPVARPSPPPEAVASTGSPAAPTPSPAPVVPAEAPGPSPAPVVTAPPAPTPPMPVPPAALPTPPVPPTPDAAKPTDPAKPPEWPKEINGRPLAEFVHDIGDPDPAVRESALRLLPGFGPAAKVAGKAIISRMDPATETDPGVKAAAFEAAGTLGFDSDADTRKAIQILAHTANLGQAGGGSRLHATMTLAAFGPKAEFAVRYLVGSAATDPAYETRRAVATTLGEIGYHEHAGPNPQALECLTGPLIQDKSAAVRLAAYQSVVALGPPYLHRDPKAPLLKDVKTPDELPKVDDKAVAKYVAAIRKQLAPRPAADKSPTGLAERDRQVEVLARLALMRLDPKEFTDENLNRITQNLSVKDTGPKLQALNAIRMMGPAAAKKLDDVVRALSDDSAAVAGAAVTALVSMGAAARPAIPALEKLKDRPGTKEEKEYWAKLSAQAIKLIMEAKSPGSPSSSSSSSSSPPPSPEPKKP